MPTFFLLNSILSFFSTLVGKAKQQATCSLSLSVLFSFSSLLLIYSIYFLYFFCLVFLSSGRIFHKTINDINDVKGEGEKNREKETERKRNEIDIQSQYIPVAYFIPTALTYFYLSK